jgi:outer membrane protein OmpA-like peptidoglycan-associated protein
MQLRSVCRPLLAVLLACATLPLAAQTSGSGQNSTDNTNQQTNAQGSAPAASYSGEEKPARAEIFAGYSWMNSGDHITRNQFGIPTTFKLGDAKDGFQGEVTFFFNRWIGATLDGGTHSGNNYDHYEILGGPTIRFPGEHIQPFIHLLVGYSKLSPFLAPDNQSIGIAGGGGLDLKVAKHWAIRLGQADYFMRDMGNPDGFSGARLGTGIVFLAGVGQQLPVSATCSVDKSEVWAGEPVTASVAPHNFNPKHTLKYEWATNGGKIQGTGDKVTVDTTGIAEGQSYNVSVHVTDPKDKKLMASCQSQFATKKRLPPTISCRATPDSVTQGDAITIHSDASSPQGGQVQVAVTSTCGASGQGTDVSVNTANIPPGSCSVTCTVTDDHQLTGTSTTTFTVKEKPVVKPPQPPPTLVLRSVYFATAQPTPKNPNGGLVRSQQATLNEIASEFKKYLAVKPDAKLTLEAHADPRGGDEYNQKLTERRADRVKSYLVEQGVPADSIETRPMGKQVQLTPDQVREQVNSNPDLTPGEKKRILRNMRLIVLANNRRVDIKVSAPGVPEQTSEHRYPWSAEDALSLIGGREKPKVAPKKAPTGKRPAARRKKGATKK